MTPAYLNSPPSPFPFLELKEDQQILLSHPLLFPSSSHQASSSSLSSPIFLNVAQDQKAIHPSELQKNQDKVGKYILDGGSSNLQVLPPSSSVNPRDASSKDSHGFSINGKFEIKGEDKRDHYESRKTRLMQKFHDHEQNNRETNSLNNNIVRTCSDCKTTKTPLWRGGPQGPKSLCNACGIRQRKARRAMLSAAAAAKDTVHDTNIPTRIKVQIKEKKSRTGYNKKPFKISSQGGEKITFEEFALSLSKNLAFRRAFPKDDEEAAVLLMALSCGLLHG